MGELKDTSPEERVSPVTDRTLAFELDEEEEAEEEEVEEEELGGAAATNTVDFSVMLSLLAAG